MNFGTAYGQYRVVKHQTSNYKLNDKLSFISSTCTPVLKIIKEIADKDRPPLKQEL